MFTMRVGSEVIGRWRGVVLSWQAERAKVGHRRQAQMEYSHRRVCQNFSGTFSLPIARRGVAACPRQSPCSYIWRAVFESSALARLREAVLPAPRRGRP